jgi:hypothetical protein
MHRDRAITHSLLALKSIKNIVKKPIYPFKKACTISKFSNASIISLESGMMFPHRDMSCYNLPILQWIQVWSLAMV